MTLRKVPGALALGLLASLTAHTALFRGEHAMGGGYHELLLQAAIGGAAMLVAFFGILAWNGAQRVADGSVLATRLAERLPGLGAVLAASTAWYAGAEFVEPHHAAASWLGIGLVLTAASWLLQLAGRALIRLLSDAIIAVFATLFAARRPCWVISFFALRPIRRVARTRRLFTRPPPFGYDCAA